MTDDLASESTTVVATYPTRRDDPASGGAVGMSKSVRYAAAVLAFLLLFTALLVVIF